MIRIITTTRIPGVNILKKTTRGNGPLKTEVFHYSFKNRRHYERIMQLHDFRDVQVTHAAGIL